MPRIGRRGNPLIGCIVQINGTSSKLALDPIGWGKYPVAMNETEQLLAAIEEFMSRSGMSSTAFGVRSVNDGKLVSRLRDGHTVYLTTAERVRRFIAEQDAPATAA